MGKSSLELDGDIDKTLWRLPYIADSKELWAAHKETVRPRQPFYDFTYQRAGADGKPHYISISGRPIFNAKGKFKGYRGIGKDVTERVETERALRESEERFRDLNELSSDWYWEQDENFCFTILSGGLFEKLGIDPEPFLGKPRWEQPGMLLSEEEWAAHRVVLEAHQPFDDFTYERTGPDGTTRHINTVSISGRPIFDGQGKFKGYRGIARNITGRVNADKSLRESEARFRELTELSADWYWEQDEKFRFTQMSGGMPRRLDFSRKPASVRLVGNNPESRCRRKSGRHIRQRWTRTSRSWTSRTSASAKTGRRARSASAAGRSSMRKATSRVTAVSARTSPNAFLPKSGFSTLPFTTASQRCRTAPVSTRS